MSGGANVSEATSHQAVLNWDIIVNIAPFLHRNSHLLQLMNTCHTLYDAGIKTLLRRTVRIGRSGPEVQSFCEFILNHPERAAHILDLLITSEFLTNDPNSAIQYVGRLSRVLRLCQHVKSLELCDAENIAVYHDLAYPLATYKHLEQIRLSQIGPLSAYLLTKLQSPVRTASITWDLIRLREEELQNPIYVCKSFADHLVYIDIVYANDIVWPGVHFPRVRHVTLHSPVYDYLSHDFSAMFPQLLELRWSWSSDPEANVLGQHREDNLYARRASASSQVTWKALSWLSCDTSRAYSMALTCSVEFWEGMHIKESAHLRHFRTVLTDIRPSRVTVAVYPTSPVSDERGEAAGFTLDPQEEFFPECGITHLNIKLRIRGRTHDVGALLSTVIKNFAGLKLKIVSIEVCYLRGSDGEPANVDRTRESLEALNFEAFATEMLNKAPQLHFAYIETICSVVLSAGWRVVRDSQDHPSLLRLDPSNPEFFTGREAPFMKDSEFYQ